jgi:penicillin-binding protein 2
MFGLGNVTGIKLAGEQKGLIPDSEWKLKRFKEPWQPGETLSVAIGQGYVDVTPIQLVSAYSAIGNMGFLYRPYLVKKIETRNGELLKEFTPELKSKIEVPSEVFQVVKEGLAKVANEPGGTAYSSRSTKTIISGKTGTAQVRAFSDIKNAKCENMDIKDRHHGWFVGYAPKDNPQIAVVAIAEHSCHGTAAAPIVKAVIDTFMVKQQAKLVEQGQIQGEQGDAVPNESKEGRKPVSQKKSEEENPSQYELEDEG